jgi:hypothetical protein
VALGNPLQLPLENLRSIHLDVHKGAPGLGMPGESLHESGIAVFAAMGTTHIRIQTVIDPGNTRFRKNGLDLLFPDHKLSSGNPSRPPFLKGGEVIHGISMDL